MVRVAAKIGPSTARKEEEPPEKRTDASDSRSHIEDIGKFGGSETSKSVPRTRGQDTYSELGAEARDVLLQLIDILPKRSCVGF